MRTATLLLALPLAACSGDAENETNTDPVVEGDVAWYGEVEPLFQRVCWRCHNPDGVGRGDWTKYENAAPMASVIAGYLQAGVMPPAAADPTCRSYDGEEHTVVTPDEIALVQAWADGGAPMGDPADAVTPGPYVEHLTDADLELRMPVTHTVQGGSDSNEYACFVVDHDRAEDFYITAFDVDLDATDVVHHMILVRIPEGVDPGKSYGASDTSQGFDCENPILGDGWEILHAWAPGMPPTEFDGGLGMKVAATDRFIVQMHYFDGDGKTDRSAYRLRTAPTVASEVYYVPVGPTGFRIPAGDASYSAEETLTNDYPVTLLVQGMFPHMHLLGRSYRSWIEKADGTEECLLESDGWDFHNQATYLFQEPARLEPGDTAHMECTWDNTNGTTDVTWGEATTEEMCFFLTYVTAEL